MTAERYVAPPAGARPMGGPDDDELQRIDDEAEQELVEIRFHEAVSEKARLLRITDRARAIVDAERAAAEPVPPFDAGLLRDVLARPAQPRWRVEGLIPAAAGTLVVAQRKTGKTTLELNLARCLLEGHDFLGRFATTQLDGIVALLNYEVSADQIARWADEVGVDQDRLFLVNLRGRRNPLRHPRDRATLATRLRDHQVETLIVDPFGRAYTGTNQNDPGEVGDWLKELDIFARTEVGAHDVILTAHAGWNGERTRGSSALDDWADVILNLTRDDDQLRYLRAEGRDVDVSEDQLAFDETTRTLTMAGAGSRRTAAKTRQAEALMPLTLELLRDNPSLSGNQLDTLIRKKLNDEGLDLKHSKGDGAKAAGLLIRRSLVASKAGPRGSTVFFLLTSPTSLVLPQGNSGDFPSSPIGREVAQGTPTTSPTREDDTLDQQEQP